MPNKDDSRQKYLVLFQILVSLVTISDWPWWASWQHFYSQGLPTKKLQATVPTSLSTSHTLQLFIHSCLSFKRTGAWGKSWSHQIYVSDLNLPTKHSTKCRPNILSILSTNVQFDFIFEFQNSFKSKTWLFIEHENVP